MGWERKRGKLEEFNRLLRGATDTSFTSQVGDLVDPAGGALLPHARRRHAAAARRREDARRHHRAPAEPRRVRPRPRPRHGGLRHPAAARERHDGERRRVALRAARTPGTPASIPTRRRSRTPTRTSSAKGSSPARASTTSTRSAPRSSGRVPENALLSHDLFEGLYARTALVTDVEVVDDYPASVLAHARRQHRWVRGDWQILCWLLPVRARRRSGLARNRLPLIARWKILDNLRRSLVAPGARSRCFAAALDGAAGQPAGVDAGRPRGARVPAAVACALATPGPAAARTSRRGVSCGRRREDLSTAVAQALLQLVFLPYQRLGDGARHRASRSCASASRSAACSSGRRRRRSARAAACSPRAALLRRARWRRARIAAAGARWPGRRSRVPARCRWPLPIARCSGSPRR